MSARVSSVPEDDDNLASLNNAEMRPDRRMMSEASDMENQIGVGLVVIRRNEEEQVKQGCRAIHLGTPRLAS